MLDRFRNAFRRPPPQPTQPSPQPEPAVILDLPPPVIGDNESHDAGLHASAVHGWYNGDGTVYPGFKVGPGDVVADIGSGDGGNSLFCAEKGARVHLSDIDLPRLEAACARIAQVAPHLVSAHPGDGVTVPFPDGFATRVICTEVVEHVDDPSVLLAELYRITTPGGLLLLACPDPTSEAIQKHLAAPIYFEKPNHLRVLSHEALEQLALDAGYVVVNRGRHGFYWAVWWSLFWCIGRDISEKNPILDNWGRCWNAILDTADGPRVQRVLDEVLSKSQILVCRRPETTAG